MIGDVDLPVELDRRARADLNLPKSVMLSEAKHL
jgi:hypothetical protein